MSEMRYPCKILVFRDIPYEQGLNLQKEYLTAIKWGELDEDVILFCEHRPVITLGRSGDGSCLLSSPEELERDGFDYLEVPRGGDITYHGTGQWTVYPILRLERFCRDLHRYMRTLEQGIINYLAEQDITGGRRDGLTGVWVGRDKICAVGVAVSRWISWHGFAFNIQPDLDLFKKHIIPCGIAASDGGVTSLQRLTGLEYDMLELIAPIAYSLFSVLPYSYSGFEIGDWQV